MLVICSYCNMMARVGWKEETYFAHWKGIQIRLAPAKVQHSNTDTYLFYTLKIGNTITNIRNERVFTHTVRHFEFLPADGTNSPGHGSCGRRIASCARSQSPRTLYLGQLLDNGWIAEENVTYKREMSEKWMKNKIEKWLLWASQLEVILYAFYDIYFYSK